MVAIPEKGILKETPLPRLLLDLHCARFDGSVRLHRERLEKNFLFQQGVPIFAESNRASETLGVQLMDAGRITRDDHSRVSAYLKEHGCKEGKALLDLGILDPKTLFVALKEQVRGRVVDCFGWPDGEFSVEPSDAMNNDAQPFRADVYSLIQEGLETHWGPERILNDLSEHMSSSVQRTGLLSRVQERLRWDDSVQAFIDALDGSQTLWRAVQNARTPRALAAAWVLDAIGGLAYGDADAPAEEAVAPEIEIALPGEASARDAAAALTGSAPTGARAPGQIDEALLREIRDKHASLGDLDHYAVLGVERGDASAAIKRAYLEAAKRYHPDALVRAGADDETREQAGKVFAAIGKAHGVLSNPAQRKDYDVQLDSDAPAIDVDRLAAAERNFRKAEILMRVGNFRGALEYLEPAVELWPEEAAYQAGLGWALYKKAPSEPERAREHLQRAVELDPSDAQTLHRLSVVARELGDEAEAASLLAQARDLDPSVG
jgi:tetratricopeptide (TPR) repeat protein